MAETIETLDAEAAAKRANAIVDAARAACDGHPVAMLGAIVGAIGQLAATNRSEGDMFYRVAIETLAIARIEFAKWCRGERPFAALFDKKEGAN